MLEIPIISESLDEEASPEPEGSRSASFSRAADSAEGESRRVSTASIVDQPAAVDNFDILEETRH